jgi:hypothetical protein
MRDDREDKFWGSLIFCILSLIMGIALICSLVR